MVIRVFFAVLVLCTLAVVAVVLAIHFRVKRHLRSESSTTVEIAQVEQPPVAVSVEQQDSATGAVKPDTDRSS